MRNLSILWNFTGVSLFKDTFTHGCVENQSVIITASFINKQLGKKKEHKAKLGKV